ncbi:hypothetical protein [Actinopolymorpha pittospori]|uniref:Uncharacterized protein n=1 Tax=Actinopolymorpha pittospori TaxID=648752 RepID=A0A927N428_9ACTN|nr:hypothetical protein [Actinopolymorpha pittospori]MBE1608577.1 hypothetical protein [Actinopolymorpha pittospori]
MSSALSYVLAEPVAIEATRIDVLCLDVLCLDVLRLSEAAHAVAAELFRACQTP